jgi:tRNA uridine 5-carbamoylmethylation protein Kti12
MLIVVGGLPGVGKTTIARELARSLAAVYVRIDSAEHRRRVESRVADIAGHRVPTWQDVVERDYRAWDRQPLMIDTARPSVSESVQAIVSALPRGA